MAGTLLRQIQKYLGNYGIQNFNSYLIILIEVEERKTKSFKQLLNMTAQMDDQGLEEVIAVLARARAFLRLLEVYYFFHFTDYDLPSGCPPFRRSLIRTLSTEIYQNGDC